MRVGFLGAGFIANIHSQSLRLSGVESECDVVRAGIFDLKQHRTAKFAAAWGHTVCLSEDEVLDTCDAVYICTWTSEHERQLAKAVERGLPVFCEKPLATTLVAAERMAATVQQAGVINQVGLVLRHSPAYLLAKHLIDDQVAGRVMAVVFRDDQFIPIQGHYRSTWRADKTLVGAGALLEHSIHDVDMLRYLVGDVASVSANDANFHELDGIEDVVSAVLAFTNRATGTLTTVWHDNLARASLRRVEVFCERRHVVIEGDDWLGPVSWTDTDGSQSTLTGDALIAAALPLAPGSLNADAEFIRSVVAHRPAWPDLAVAVEAHRIVEAMYASAREGGAAKRVTPLMRVVELTTADTYALRRAVLRDNDPSRDVTYAEDDDPAAFHLGVVDDNNVVIATSTWVPRPAPGSEPRRSMQLRGMATAAHLQGTGIGGELFEAGVGRCAANGFEVIWAKARDSALEFYARHRCRVVGDGFIDDVTNLPHHIVVRDLDQPS